MRLDRHMSAAGFGLVSSRLDVHIFLIREVHRDDLRTT